MARILVIEDNEVLRKLIQRMLNEVGHEMLLASESSNGLRLWQAHEVELVVDDIGLPGRSGLETIIDMRTLDPSLPIVVISGREEEELIELISGAGLMSSVRIVTKPFQIDELVAAVHATLVGHSPRAALVRTMDPG